MRLRSYLLDPLKLRKFDHHHDAMPGTTEPCIRRPDKRHPGFTSCPRPSKIKALSCFPSRLVVVFLIKVIQLFLLELKLFELED